MAGALLASCVEESDVRLDLEKASAPVLPEFADVVDTDGQQAAHRQEPD